MDSQNQEHVHMETLFDLELDYPPVFIPEIANFQSSGFYVDEYTMSSARYLGSQGRNVFPSETEVESGMQCKRLKLVSPTSPCGYVSVPETSSPLGLTLRKTPSFLDLVESKLSYSNAPFSMFKNMKSSDKEASVSQSNGKTKASNFSASLLRIGSWERVSRYDGDLVVKCYFAKRKLVWEVLDGGLKKKIELQWSDIASLKATCENSAPQTLEVELLKRPIFFRETNPQPRKHTLWKSTTDFTDGQASVFRRHFLQFPQGVLQKQFEKLLQLDDRLYSLSKKPYPSLDSAYFGTENLQSPNSNDHELFDLRQSSISSKELFKSEHNVSYSELLHFTLSKATAPQRFLNLSQTNTSSKKVSEITGGSTKFPSHGASIATTNEFPNLFVSLPSFIDDFETFTSSENYYKVEINMEEVKTDLLGNIGVCVQDGNLNPKLYRNSTSDFNYWIAENQTNQNRADSSEDINYNSEENQYLTRFSYVGEMSASAEDFSNCIAFSSNMSSTSTNFPVL
ncbi:Atp-dependent dna helicase [Thalictrum thalictroides]|uniref:Atp-dependent dna helicase n=1 Tax=Thalictrum thalictroides TaxID=46969 RepID=A0A7J6X034_THATH|nr:Atp-dependent dna helicase [Thalictrum thalictroides]